MSEPVVFALNGSRGFGERVADHLGLRLAAHEERDFPEGEHKARPLVELRGRQAYVIHSLHGGPDHSVNDKLCRLLFFLGAVRDAGADRVTALCPYLCYSRKDRRTKARDPVSTRYVAALFEAVGVDCVVTMDVHNLAAYQNAFRIRAEHLEARALFIEHLVSQLEQRDVVVVSPDVGGTKRALLFAEGLGRSLGRTVPTAFMEKVRSGGVLRTGALVGQVADRVAVIVDDLIGTGSTQHHAVQALRAHGATDILCVATHGLFVEDAGRVFADDAIRQVVIADTVPPFRLDPEVVDAKVTLVDGARMFAEAIRCLHDGRSIEALVGMES